MWTTEQENLADFYGWDSIFSDFYIGEAQDWDDESLNTQFYTAEMSAWTTVFSDYTFDDGNTWKTRLAPGIDLTRTFLGVSEAPEDLDLFPEEFYINPEDIQADSDDWVIFAEAD